MNMLPISDLGALKLDADEIAALEKWMTEPTKPTDLMVKAVKAHKVLRARQLVTVRFE